MPCSRCTLFRYVSVSQTGFRISDLEDTEGEISKLFTSRFRGYNYSLPVFPPAKRRRNASGAFSMPLTMWKRRFRLPSFSHDARSRSASG